MKKLILALLPIVCLAADPIPVIRPQPLTYAPNPNATTISIKWYHYAVYLEQVLAVRNQEIATLRTQNAQPGADLSVQIAALSVQQNQILADTSKIIKNTELLFERYHAMNMSFIPLLGTISTNVKILVDRPSNVVITPTTPNPDDAKIGTRVELAATADGTPAPTWQWKKDGNDIPGATNATLVFATLVAGDSGTYTAVATNELGSAQASVKLNVVP